MSVGGYDTSYSTRPDETTCAPRAVEVAQPFELQNLLALAHQQVDPDADDEPCKCGDCGKSVLKEPLYYVQQSRGGTNKEHVRPVPTVVRCIECGFDCVYCGHSVGVVQCLDEHCGWNSCAECAKRERGVECGSTFFVPVGPFPELPAVEVSP